MSRLAPRCEFCGAPMVQFDEDDWCVQCAQQCAGFREAWDKAIEEEEIGGEG